MENATKALIIAAAILIAIVLISLGVYVLNIGQESISGADMTEQEISTFNAKFTAYTGKAVLGSKVNALLTAIQTNNVSEGSDGRQVAILGDCGQCTPTKTSDYTKALTGASYDVDITKESSAGLIQTITITKKTE